MRRWLGAFVLVMLAACGGAAAEKPHAAAGENGVPAKLLAWCPDAPAPRDSGAPQGTGRGTVEGVVSDKASGAPLSDVTVIVTSSALQGSASGLTDAQGMYRVQGLPPGSYEIVFYYGEIKIRQMNVIVGNDKVTPVPIKMDLSGTGGGTVNI